MPEAVVQEYVEGDLIPEDTLFRGVLMSVKEKQVEWDDKFTGQRVKDLKWDWLFKITDGEYIGRTVRGDTFARLNTGSQPFEWVKALNGGQEPAIGANINTDHYIGVGCMFEVSHRGYKSRQGEDKIAVEVARVYPLNGSASPY